MAKKKQDTRQARQADTGANLGFEAKLWAAADALRNNMDAAEYLSAPQFKSPSKTRHVSRGTRSRRFSTIDWKWTR